MVGLSIGEQDFIRGGIAQDLRTDGRKRLTYRPIYVETGVIAQANGSARVRIGGTDVIASVKAEIGRPSSLHPESISNKERLQFSLIAVQQQSQHSGRGGEELSSELEISEIEEKIEANGEVGELCEVFVLDAQGDVLWRNERSMCGSEE